MDKTDEHEELPYCGGCGGTGEGQFDGTRCSWCGGTGFERHNDPDDFDIPEDWDA